MRVNDAIEQSLPNAADWDTEMAPLKLLGPNVDTEPPKRDADSRLTTLPNRALPETVSFEPRFDLSAKLQVEPQTAVSEIDDAPLNTADPQQEMPE